QVLDVLWSWDIGPRSHQHAETGFLPRNSQLLRHPLAIGRRVRFDRTAATGGCAPAPEMLVHERGAADGIRIEIAADRTNDAASRHIDAGRGRHTLRTENRTGKSLEASHRCGSRQTRRAHEAKRSSPLNRCSPHLRSMHAITSVVHYPR